jgi:S-adenosylmethionine synthetase
MGEISTAHHVDYTKIAREAIRRTGYNKPDYLFDADSCGIIVAIKEQSREIASAVGEDMGAGDQGMMIGFACNETPEYMPLPISLAHKICYQLAQCRKEGIIPYLRPDGKSQVTAEYSYGMPKRLNTVVVAAQHDPGIEGKQLWDDIVHHVVTPVLGPWMDGLDDESIHVNTSGSFILGGPAGDSGLSGRKNIVDSYGTSARHGGGSYSGKDPSKVDRSATYAARYVAKNVVAAGLTDRLELEVCYAIGHRQPISIGIETFGTHHVDPQLILKLIKEHFDLSPGAIIRDLDLRRPIFWQTAAYGHFGRTDIETPWERLDKADALRRAAGLPEPERTAS